MRVVAQATTSVFRDGMASRLVSRQLADDFWVQPNEAMIRHWCRVYTNGLDCTEEHRAEVISAFSGVLYVDAVSRGELALLLAVDPAAPDGDRLVGYQMVLERRVRQEGIAESLTRLRQAGVPPEEAIAKRSQLYRQC